MIFVYFVHILRRGNKMLRNLFHKLLDKVDDEDISIICMAIKISYITYMFFAIVFCCILFYKVYEVLK